MVLSPEVSGIEFHTAGCEYVADSMPESSSRPRALPQTQYLSITTANLPAIRKKITELNSSTSSDVALSDSEMQTLETLIKQLQSSPKDPKPQEDQLGVIFKIATQWEPANRLPGLDILRLCAVAPSFVQHTSGGQGTIVETLAESGVFAADYDRPNNTMLAVRVLGNLFVSEEGRLIADGCFETIVSSVNRINIPTSNKGLATAVATLYINYAVLLVSGAPASESSSREQRAQAIVDGAVRLTQPDRDSETVYRSLVAVGSLMSLGDEFRKSVAGSRGIPDMLRRLEGSAVGKEARIATVIREMRDQLK